MGTRINSFFEKSRQYLRELRRAPNERKKRWVILTSALALALIIALWTFYLNLTLPSLTEKTEVSSSTPTATASKSKNSFFEIFNRGLKITSQNLEEAFLNFKNTISNYLNRFQNQIKENNEIFLQAPEETFEPQNQESIPPTTLP